MPEPALRIDGVHAARTLRARIAQHIDGAQPVCLATVLVGEDPASRLYINRKIDAAREAGIVSRHAGLPQDIPQEELLAHVAGLAADPAVHGILVQMPLPAHLDASRVLRAIPPAKDVDGLTETNLGRLAAAQPGLRPCTPTGVMELLATCDIDTTGACAVVVGRSRLVGVPMMLMLSHKGVDATATLAHSRTRDLASVTREADILVAASGSPGLIGAEHVKPGAFVFDVGVSRTADGAIAGDVRFAEVCAVVGGVTPMPGGTGPMTVACLLLNTVRAAACRGVARAWPGDPGDPRDWYT